MKSCESNEQKPEHDDAEKLIEALRTVAMEVETLNSSIQLAQEGISQLKEKLRAALEAKKDMKKQEKVETTLVCFGEFFVRVGTEKAEEMLDKDITEIILDIKRVESELEKDISDMKDKSKVLDNLKALMYLI